MKMVKILEVVVVAVAFSQVWCLDSELQKHSVLYGISVLAENETDCSRQLHKLRVAAEMKQVWALKGN